MEAGQTRLETPSPSSQLVGWRPIETAPKDGTPVLVGHEQAVFSAWWEKDGTQTNTNHPGWVDGTTNSYEEYTTYEPTHWMPLPAPPATATPEGGE
jgi:hypothetical protein